MTDPTTTPADVLNLADSYAHVYSFVHEDPITIARDALIDGLNALASPAASAPASKEAQKAIFKERFAFYQGALKDARLHEGIAFDLAYLKSIQPGAALKPTLVASHDQFQARVAPWLFDCFGAEISADRSERNHRFIEEALELVQSTGCTASEAHQLVDYVYGRPVGEPVQEVGGVMVTLAALCLANGLDMHDAGEIELARIWTMVEKIRAKQAAKPKHSPLPESPAPAAIDLGFVPTFPGQRNALDEGTRMVTTAAAEMNRARLTAAELPMVDARTFLNVDGRCNCVLYPAGALAPCAQHPSATVQPTPAASPADVFELMIESRRKRYALDQSCTPAFLQWLDTMTPREGVGSNEAWNAGVAWQKHQELLELAEQAEQSAAKYKDQTPQEWAEKLMTGIDMHPWPDGRATLIQGEQPVGAPSESSAPAREDRESSADYEHRLRGWWSDRHATSATVEVEVAAPAAPTPALTLPIQPGKRYVQRSGAIVETSGETPGMTSIIDRDYSVRTVDGAEWGSISSMHDLVADASPVQHEGMTVAGDGAAMLGALMREQHDSRRTGMAATVVPTPHHLNQVAELMRAIDAYAADYKSAGKLAAQRFHVERLLSSELTAPHTLKPSGVHIPTAPGDLASRLLHAFSNLGTIRGNALDAEDKAALSLARHAVRDALERPLSDAQAALRTRAERILSACESLTPKQAVGEMLVAFLAMPEWQSGGAPA